MMSFQGKISNFTSRQLQLWVGDEKSLSPLFVHLPPSKSAVWIGDSFVKRLSLPSLSTMKIVPFNQAKNLLGQEFNLIIYDARAGLNLDALAAVSGTLRQPGLLIMLFSQWEQLTQWQDPDSLRWSGEALPIPTPHFVRFFQQCVKKYGFPVYHFPFSSLDCPSLDFPERQENVPQENARQAKSVDSDPTPTPTPTLEQQQLLQQIATSQADIILLTAKRGRGKSALAGFWAKQLCSQHQPLILTAPNKSAVDILHVFAGEPLPFLPPDALCAEIEQNPHAFSQAWLLIDEAAMIPLNLLERLTSAFQRVLCTTTTQSYEGTGRGFLLKFKANLHRTFVHIELHQPLRWQKNDRLEGFIENLLLLDDNLVVDNLSDSGLSPDPVPLAYQVQAYSPQQLKAEKWQDFYALLSLAHYRTSPVDLRRLLDAPKQQFYLATSKDQLLGGVWLVEEGKFSPESQPLIQDIARGVRRPRGNLVAQLLCFQGNFPQACRLSSLRISRIAVHPHCQHQGIGQRLIKEISQQAEVDFLSVSFGYTQTLATFWQKCGFVFVHLSEQKEASSGGYSVVALKPLTAKGKVFCQQAQQQFQRNLPLSWHPLAASFADTPFTMEKVDWQLLEQDWAMLHHFADFYVPLSASLPAIQRFLAGHHEADCPTLQAFLQHKRLDLAEMTGKKQWLNRCRQEMKKVLQNYAVIL
ncbi:tRNA(Met) cytidine acetyltransferase TmcA [Pasteurella sp. PK-2025]|uniref:tRNA(Met) cytidine acetyltransferase TmcA n=1 Tax=Pasteurella sp. PK-2025 TaxID=3413133 RepID=UPI003C75D7B1